MRRQGMRPQTRLQWAVLAAHAAWGQTRAGQCIVRQCSWGSLACAPTRVAALGQPHTRAGYISSAAQHAGFMGNARQHAGFMSNARQQRAAGLAAMELAQRFLTELDAQRNGSHTWVSSEGASAADDAEGRHRFAWRDAMDTVVRWRQISEPNDQVRAARAADEASVSLLQSPSPCVCGADPSASQCMLHAPLRMQVLWVDRLTPEEFRNGFGSHTPMFSGQTKCVRYYMNCGRALALFGSIVAGQRYVVNADNQHVQLSALQLRAVAEVCGRPASALFACQHAPFLRTQQHSAHAAPRGHGMQHVMCCVECGHELMTRQVA
jgi:hypothetical protein